MNAKIILDIIEKLDDLKEQAIEHSNFHVYGVVTEAVEILYICLNQMYAEP